MHILKNILAMAVVIAMSYSSMVQAQTKTNNNMESVIVYFTYSGNTELAAKQIAKVTGAKMIRLLPEQPYSSEDVDWTNEQSRCTQEHLNQSLRPAIKSVDIDFAKIDTVFVGYPALKIRKGLRLPAKLEEIKKWIKQ